VDRRESWFERLVASGGLEVALAVAFGALSLVLGWSTGDPVGVLLDLAMFVTAALTIRWPRAAGLALGVLLTGYLFAPPPWVELGQYAPLFAVIGAGVRGHRRLRTVMTAGYLAIYVLVQEQDYPGDIRFVLSSLVWMTLFALAWLVGSASHRYTELQAELRAAALNEQRSQLARGLHDTVSRTLTRVALRAREASINGDVTALDEVAEGVSRAASELRWMLNLLRDPQPEAQLAAASGSIAEAVQETTSRLQASGHQFSATIEGDPATVPDAIGNVVVLAIEEAAANLERHASASEPSALVLSVGDQQLDLVVMNEIAADASTGSAGLGLLGLRERLSAVGGELEAGREGTQWLTRLRVPLGPARSG
jgi:signal transduction histidine kinase